MPLLFLIAALNADPELPANYRAYFERSDAEKMKLIELCENRVSDIESAILGEPIRERKGALRIQLKAANTALDTARRTRPTCLHSIAPDKDEIGLLPEGRIKIVIDNDTALLQTHNGRHVILNMDTRHLRTGQQFLSQDAWIVTATKTENKDILRHIGFGLGYYAAAPLHQDDIKSFRTFYDHSKADLKPTNEKGQAKTPGLIPAPKN